MTHRLQNFFMAFMMTRSLSVLDTLRAGCVLMLAIASLFWAQSFASQNNTFFENPTSQKTMPQKTNSGGYQLFGQSDSEHFADNPLNALEKILASPETAPECCNVPNTGRFDNITPNNTAEAEFLANAEATFGSSSTWTNVTRHNGELVIQRSDIDLSPQNIIRMQNGQAPFVRNTNGDWEPIQLHHVGRETGQMIEVTQSQNTYNPSTGGPLHIAGPGGPVRQSNYTQSYWQQRYQDLVSSGQTAQ